MFSFVSIWQSTALNAKWSSFSEVQSWLHIVFSNEILRTGQRDQWPLYLLVSGRIPYNPLENCVTVTQDVGPTYIYIKISIIILFFWVDLGCWQFLSSACSSHSKNTFIRCIKVGLLHFTYLKSLKLKYTYFRSISNWGGLLHIYCLISRKYIYIEYMHDK